MSLKSGSVCDIILIISEIFEVSDVTDTYVTYASKSAIIQMCINHFMQADFFITLPHNKFSCNNKPMVMK